MCGVWVSETSGHAKNLGLWQWRRWPFTQLASGNFCLSTAPGVLLPACGSVAATNMYCLLLLYAFRAFSQSLLLSISACLPLLCGNSLLSIHLISTPYLSQLHIDDQTWKHENHSNCNERYTSRWIILVLPSLIQRLSILQKCCILSGYHHQSEVCSKNETSIVQCGIQWDCHQVEKTFWSDGFIANRIRPIWHFLFFWVRRACINFSIFCRLEISPGLELFCTPDTLHLLQLPVPGELFLFQSEHVYKSANLAYESSSQKHVCLIQDLPIFHHQDRDKSNLY